MSDWNYDLKIYNKIYISTILFALFFSLEGFIGACNKRSLKLLCMREQHLVIKLILMIAQFIPGDSSSVLLQ